jgi:hypothetical protein
MEEKTLDQIACERIFFLGTLAPDPTFSFSDKVKIKFNCAEPSREGAFFGGINYVIFKNWLNRKVLNLTKHPN